MSCSVLKFALVAMSLAGCSAAQTTEMKDFVARRDGVPTKVENKLREKVLAGTATPTEHEVWRSKVASRTAIRAADAAQRAKVAAAIASRPPAAVAAPTRQEVDQPMMRTVTQFHDGGMTNHTVTDMGGGHSTIHSW